MNARSDELKEKLTTPHENFGDDGSLFLPSETYTAFQNIQKVTISKSKTITTSAPTLSPQTTIPITPIQGRNTISTQYMILLSLIPIVLFLIFLIFVGFKIYRKMFKPRVYSFVPHGNDESVDNLELQRTPHTRNLATINNSSLNESSSQGKSEFNGSIHS